MQDRSHKLLFLGASALMCAASMLGSQAGPWLLVDDNAFPAVSFSPLHRTQFASDTGLIRDSHARPVFIRVANVETRGSTATIVPNGASCPAANAARMITPGSAPPTASAPQPPLQSDAALGTGSSCPPARADARTDVVQGGSPATPKPLTANNLPERRPQP